MANIIDSLLISLGFKVDTSGLDEMRGKVESARASLLGWGHALAGLVGGFSLHKVAEIGSQFEQNRIQIAGFLSALSQGQTSYNEGLEQASGVIQQITTDAAKLPGEAEEYVEVFKAGLPFIKQARPDFSLDQITAFTNRLTAIGKTFGLDAGVIAREADHLLSPDKGMASLRLPLFRQLLPFMKQVEGHAKVTAQSFNTMTAPQRLELLSKAFEKLQPMLDASANSFDAMWGTLVSTTKQLVRIGTEGLFGEMKKGISDLAATFVDADGKLTKTGKDVVGVLAEVGKYIGATIKAGVAFIKWLAQDDAAAKTLKLSLKAVALVLLGLGGAVFLVAQDLWGFFHGMDSVTGQIVERFQPALYAVIALLGGLAIAFSPVVTAIGLLIIGVYELQKHWHELNQGVQDSINGWIEALNMVLDKINALLGVKNGLHINEVNLRTWTEESGALASFKAPKHFVRSGEEEETPAWLTPRSAPTSRWATGAQPALAAPGGGSVRHGDVTFNGGINITAPDAPGAARAVRGVLRNAQTGRKL